MKLEQIWSQYRSGLKAFLHSRLDNEADVEDLLQDILIKSHSKLSQLHNQDSLKSWLFQIANNSLIDFYRRRGKKLAQGELLWYESTEQGPGAALPQDVWQQLRPCLEPFIAALPEQSAELLRAVELEGQSQKQLADELGISYSTLKSRVQKARKQLRKLYQSCCSFDVDQRGMLLEAKAKAKAGACKGC
ncbi:RNA polymerase sigma factor SigZ [Agaribacterium haliotis]|uniref:RNA polymerase sigma factor SigZ n=1 Tax=Agaribacterium haliotis TaxID=2013869 RepID=UPI000BB578CB|nr:RNA polymerase sigma factor SigZ [Agaribacterium haliotis]